MEKIFQKASHVIFNISEFPTKKKFKIQWCIYIFSKLYIQGFKHILDYIYELSYVF